MNKKHTYLIAVGLAIFIAWGLYYFLRTEPIPDPAPPKEQDTRVLSFSGNKLVEEQQGKIQWEIAANTIEVEIATRRARMLGFNATLYQEDGSQVTIRADQAVMDPDSRDIDIQGSVHVVSAGKKADLAAGSLRWSSAQRRFYGANGVTIQQEDTVITGQEMESDERLEKMIVRGDARVRRRDKT